MAKKGLLHKLKAILGRVWDEGAPAVAQGSSELASAMYTGSGFVQYPRDGKATDTLAALQKEASEKQPVKDSREQAKERSGPEL